MASADLIIGNWRKGRFFFISLGIHIAAFILMGMVVFNVVREPREFVSVQLVKVTQQVKKLRRSAPRLRSQAVNHTSLPRRWQNAAKPLIHQGSISSQVATEVIPVFQYEPAALKELKMYPEMASARKPLSAPRMATSKPVVGSSEKTVFEIHDQLSKLSSPYDSVSLSVRTGSDPAILRDFLQTVSKRIEKSKRYPRWARDAGLEGKVVIRFAILRDGKLDEEIQLVSSSGTEVLDNAAIAAVKGAAPFPALPRSLSRERLQIELPMDFRLRSS